jgi:hypothetical protein
LRLRAQGRWGERRLSLGEPLLMAAIIFSLVIGIASRNVCIGVLPKHQCSLQVRSYHRCELDRIGEMRDLKNKMWKYGSFGGTERSLTSATYFDTR